MSLTSVDLPEPRHAGDGDEQAERELDGEVLEVVLPRAPDHEPRVGRAAAAWPAPGCVRLPARYWPVIDALFLSSAFTVPACTTSPPCSPAPGPMSTT